MSIFSDIGNAISDAADAVAGAVEDVVNAVEEVVADVFETVGNVVSDVFNAVGDYLGAAIGEGAVLSSAVRGVFHWIGDIVSGVTDLAGAVIKGVLGIVGGVIGGVIRLVGGGIGGLLAWDGSVFVKGLEDIFYSIGGAVVLVGGKLLGLVQSLIPMPGQGSKRPLREEEERILRTVFRKSVALYNIRLIEGYAGLIFGVNDYPFTLGNTIYTKGSKSRSTLVHECTHVWQYQNIGARYTVYAIVARATEGYSWETELARGATRWQDFNFEAEGKFLEDLFDEGKIIGSHSPIGNGQFYKDDPVGSDVEFKPGVPDRTDLAKKTVAYVRDAFAWRLSALI